MFRILKKIVDNSNTLLLACDKIESCASSKTEWNFSQSRTQFTYIFSVNQDPSESHAGQMQTLIAIRGTNATRKDCPRPKGHQSGYMSRRRKCLDQSDCRNLQPMRASRYRIPRASLPDKSTRKRKCALNVYRRLNRLMIIDIKKPNAIKRASKTLVRYHCG